MADIDDFKAVNDTHGHQIGDAVLTNIGSAFLSNLRTADFEARYGGEELVAVLPHTKGNSAAIVAEKIRNAVSEQRLENRFSVTISIGVACWHDHMKGPTDLIQAANRALYAAKEAGKNRVVIDECNFADVDRNTDVC